MLSFFASFKAVLTRQALDILRPSHLEWSNVGCDHCVRARNLPSCVSAFLFDCLSRADIDQPLEAQGNQTARGNGRPEIYRSDGEDEEVDLADHHPIDLPTYVAVDVGTDVSESVHLLGHPAWDFVSLFRRFPDGLQRCIWF